MFHLTRDLDAILAFLGLVFLSTASSSLTNLNQRSFEGSVRASAFPENHLKDPPKIFVGQFVLKTLVSWLYLQRRDMDDHQDKIATLADGRKVSYTVYGSQESNAPTFFYLHGFPGSHHEGYVINTAAAQHGVRVIAPTRPGYGDSTFQKNRRILDYPKDIIELADILSIKQFAVLGVSGGGPYAIACLKDLPQDRLVGIGTVAGVMPMSFSTQGMLTITRVMFNIAPYATGIVGWITDRVLGNTARDTKHPEKLEEMMDKDISARSASDKEVWETHPDLRKSIGRATREAMKQGGYATAWEARLFGSNWGFKLEDVKVEKGRMIMWHGDLDVNVPIGVSEKAVQLMPGAELRVMKGESHLSLVTKVEEFTVAMKDMLSKSDPGTKQI